MPLLFQPETVTCVPATMICTHTFSCLSVAVFIYGSGIHYASTAVAMPDHVAWFLF